MFNQTEIRYAYAYAAWLYDMPLFSTKLGYSNIVIIISPANFPNFQF